MVRCAAQQLACHQQKLLRASCLLLQVNLRSYRQLQHPVVLFEVSQQ